MLPPRGRRFSIALRATKNVRRSCTFDCNLHCKSRASTPPAEERVTSFFARVKKEVTKKEGTLRGAPGFTHRGSERERRWRLRVRRGRSTALHRSPFALSVAGIT